MPSDNSVVFKYLWILSLTPSRYVADGVARWFLLRLLHVRKKVQNIRTLHFTFKITLFSATFADFNYIYFVCVGIRYSLLTEDSFTQQHTSAPQYVFIFAIWFLTPSILLLNSPLQASVTSSSSDERMAFQDFRILLIALVVVVRQRESKDADCFCHSTGVSSHLSAICFNFCFLFADSLNMFTQFLTRDKQLRATGTSLAVSWSAKSKQQFTQWTYIDFGYITHICTWTPCRHLPMLVAPS